MKTIRLNLKRGVRSWSFILYDSVEAAYFMKDDPAPDDDDDELRKVVTLRAGEVIEIEWIGTEWVYDDADESAVKGQVSCLAHEKYDNIHIGKLIPLKGTKPKTGILEGYSGWVRSGTSPWTAQAAQKSVRITEIEGSTRPKVDFSRLFPDDAEEHVDNTGDFN